MSYAIHTCFLPRYVMGGYTHIATQSCGDNSCGGGYRYFLNDVWRSKKECSALQRAVDPDGCNSAGSAFGEEWERVEMIVPWRGRGGHALLVFKGEMWILGGRGGSTIRSNENLLFNDVWAWDGASNTSWVRMDNATWSPRANFNAGVVKDSYDYFEEAIILYGGEDVGK